MELLSDKPELQQIYVLLSKSINRKLEI